MAQRVEIQSSVGADELKRRLSALYEHRHWRSLPKGIVGRISGSRVRIAIENGMLFWVGRGSFEGSVTGTETESALVGELNSPMVAVLAPLVLFVPMVILMPLELPKILLLAALFCGIGYFVVKSDHAQLVEVLRESTK